MPLQRPSRNLRLKRSNRRQWYYSKEYPNPYFIKEKRSAKRKIVARKIARAWLWLALGLSLALSMAWILFFSRLFEITDINVTIKEPTEIALPAELKLNPDDIKNTANEYLGTRFLMIAPRNNLLLMNAEKLSRTINIRFQLAGLAISRKFPHTLNILAVLNNYALVWQENGRSYYITSAGRIIKEADPAALPLTQYPIIDNRGQAKITDMSIRYSNLSDIIKIYGRLKTEYNVKKFIVDSDGYSILVEIDKGPVFKFTTAVGENKPGLEKQLNDLRIFINEKLKGDFEHKEYIDLRYGDRIFYK